VTTLKTRIEQIERARPEWRDVEDMSDDELLAVIQKSLAKLPPGFWELGRSYTPTETELQAFAAGKVKDLSDDALAWVIAKVVWGNESTNPTDRAA
jgi:hypothetical protein